MKTFETNTNIWPCCWPGTYDGPLSYESLWQDYAMQDEEEGYIVCDDYDFGAFKEAVVSEAQGVFDDYEPLKGDGVIKVHVTGMGSPREYNFMTDWLEFRVDVEDDFLDRAEKVIFSDENIDKSREYIQDHFCSRDGFISYMPDSVEEIRDCIEQLKNRRDGDTLDEEIRWFGAVIALLWNIRHPKDKHGYEFDDDETGEQAITRELAEQVGYNHSLSEFCTVYSPEEVKERLGDHMIDFDGVAKGLKEQVEKYEASVVSDSGKAKARNWLQKGLERIRNLKECQLDRIRRHCGSWEEAIEELDEFREEWEEEKTRMWKEDWK